MPRIRNLDNQRSRVYLVLNLVGSAVLTLLAWREEQWGFLLLEEVWADHDGRPPTGTEFFNDRVRHRDSGRRLAGRLNRCGKADGGIG